MGIEAEIRHKYICDNLASQGKVYVKELAELLGVTPVTVRRDLKFLQENGFLKKAYGGAVLSAPEVNVSARYRRTRRPKAKQVVGKLAGTLIQDNDIIYLESGSTCYEIIPHLADRRGLTIIVNSLYLMRRLHELAGHRIIIVGGQYRPDRMDMVGPAAENAISQLSGFKAFTGADDIAIDAGISGADVVTVGFARLVLKQASKVIFVGDDTKFDNPALYKIADIDQLNYIVTNKSPSAQWHKIAKRKQIKLLYPE